MTANGGEDHILGRGIDDGTACREIVCRGAVGSRHQHTVRMVCIDVSAVDGNSGVGEHGKIASEQRNIISANGVGIDCRPDYIYLVAPNGSSFTNDRITLEEYVTTYGNGSGSGTAIAVFG